MREEQQACDDISSGCDLTASGWEYYLLCGVAVEFLQDDGR